MSIYNIEVRTSRGQSGTLSPYKGQVMLIVNTATQCGFAPQFKGLQQLHERYRDRGLAVLAFPCGQFRNQELEGDEAITQACELNFGVTFPVYAKIDVNGEGAHPLFRHLRNSARGFLGTTSIKWNFTKFLVDRDGRVLKRFSPTDTPEKIEAYVKQLL